MGLTIAMDIGSTATKIAGLHPDGSLHSKLRIQEADPESSLRRGLQLYLQENQLTEADISRLALTGVGAAFVKDLLPQRSVRVVEEFDASSRGALALAGVDQALVVTMGTGTAFLWAETNGTIRHLCGSGIGGGTLSGLGLQLTGESDFSTLNALAEQGELKQVDLTIADVAEEVPDTLDPDMTASNYGKLNPHTSPADRAAGVFNLVLQAIGTMTVLGCQLCNTQTVVVTGSLASLRLTRENFDLFHRLYGIRYILPEQAAFATAIGAGLSAMNH